MAVRQKGQECRKPTNSHTSFSVGISLTAVPDDFPSRGKKCRQRIWHTILSVRGYLTAVLDGCPSRGKGAVNRHILHRIALHLSLEATDLRILLLDGNT